MSTPELDPEIEAMSVLRSALAPLDDTTRGRVLRWAFDRYGLPALNSTAPDLNGAGPVAAEQAPAIAPPATAAPTAEPSDSRFQHFAELFNAVKPKTGPEKALVSGYWFQIILGKPSFTAAEANIELKHLGHVLPNVTDALTANQNKKPALVLQLKKAGNSRQARKTYKLTHEGLQWIISRLD